MKWLFLYKSEQSQYVAHLTEFVEKLGVETIALPLEPKPAVAHAVKLHDALQTISRCIIFDWNNSSFDAIIQYAVGFSSGRGAIIMLCTDAQNEKDAKLCPWYVHKNMCFASFDDLCAAIKTNIDEYMRLDATFTARHRLFKRGIPLTADVAAQYVAKGDIETLALLLQAGIPVDSRDFNGTPLLCIAAREEQVKMVSYLLSMGADIDILSEDRGYSAVMDATQRVNADIVKILLDNGAKLDFISRDGQTVLILAVGANADDICNMLAAHGADMDVKDKMGMSAFEYAQLFKRKNLVELFKKYRL